MRRALAEVAAGHDCDLHGNGLRAVGLLALMGSAYTTVEAYPLDILGAQTEGMIGYSYRAGAWKLPAEGAGAATLLTMVEVDGDDPAFANPTKPIGPIYEKAEADRLAAEKGWAFKPDGPSFRRVVPSPAPKRIFGLELPDQVAARARAPWSSAPEAAASQRATPTSLFLPDDGSSASRP